MRVFCFFDLPTLTTKERRDYRQFRNFLIKTGFIMMQESVYSKLCLNTTAAKTVIKNVKAHKPNSGIVEIMIVTEKQYADIEYIVGNADSEYVTTAERLVVL